MSFRKTAGGLVQTFYAGLSLQTEYASLHTRAGPSGTTMLLYLPGQSRISETLHLSTDRGMLVQQTPGFRAHTYLRCAFPPEKLPRKKT
ncbi:MAG: hypothetical protein JOY77_11260 [Alphaproteobacteria bacterium]|nr:hypothetical protein [Alphaproteobacteria bacterium]MBV9063488.1 hypothetical protein [Alphaproteobacteria bacterium]